MCSHEYELVKGVIDGGMKGMNDWMDGRMDGQTDEGKITCLLLAFIALKNDYIYTITMIPKEPCR